MQYLNFMNSLVGTFCITLEAFTDYATNLRLIFQKLVHEFEAPPQTLAVNMVIEAKCKLLLRRPQKVNLKFWFT